MEKTLFGQYADILDDIEVYQTRMEEDEDFFDDAAIFYDRSLKELIFTCDEEEIKSNIKNKKEYNYLEECSEAIQTLRPVSYQNIIDEVQKIERAKKAYGIAKRKEREQAEDLALEEEMFETDYEDDNEY